MKLKYLIPIVLMIYSCSTQKSKEQIIGEWIFKKDNEQISLVFSDNYLTIRGSNIDNKYNWIIISDTLRIEECTGKREKLDFLIASFDNKNLELRVENFFSPGFENEKFKFKQSS